MSVEERNLLSVACKNVIGAKRAGWRQLDNSTKKTAVTESSKEKIASDLKVLVNEMVDILKNDLLPRTESPEGKVFFLKQMADYSK